MTGPARSLAGPKDIATPNTRPFNSNTNHGPDNHLPPIMERLGLNRSNWVETVRGFGRLFKQAAGRSSSLVDAAARRSRRWFQGKAAARTAFV
jgi:hypothetical protein